MKHDQQTKHYEVKPKGGKGRAYIIARLRRMGFVELATQVVAREVTARHAALLAGFGDTSKDLRQDEVVVKREDAALERERRKHKIDPAALIGCAMADEPKPTPQPSPGPFPPSPTPAPIEPIWPVKWP